MSRNIHCGVVEFVAHERDSSRAPLYLGYSSSSIAAKTTAAAVTAEAAVGGQLTAAAAPLAAGGRLTPVVGVSPLPHFCHQLALSSREKAML